MKKFNYFLALFGFILTLLTFDSSFSQVNQEWVARYNGTGDSTDQAKSIAVDNFGNVYVTGGSIGSGVYPDYVTIKYNSSGVQQWLARYYANGNSATSIILDDSDNVYVTGASATIKYSSSGAVKWIANQLGGSIAVDEMSNVYVTGYGFAEDYSTTKFNSSGVQQWVAIYNGPGNSTDRANSIAVDNSGNVYVCGESSGIGTGFDFATIKYNSSGDSQWVARYDGQGNEQVFSMALDDSGNVYVTGVSGLNGDYVTIKYDSSGDSVWVARYNGPGNVTDVPKSISVDSAHNVYVTGYSYGFGTNGEYATIKYNSIGDSVWVRRFHGIGNSYGFASALALDDSGNVYVTGSCTDNGAVYDYTTIKYNSLGDSVWIKRYNGTGNSYDDPSSVLLDNSGNVYVTGKSIGIGSYYDYATIKYSLPIGITQISSVVPDQFTLNQNYPNPFNPVTNLEFGISKLEFVSLKIFDVMGREIKTLVNERLAPGRYNYQFSIINYQFPSGVYFYRLTAGEFTDTKRMMLLK